MSDPQTCPPSFGPAAIAGLVVMGGRATRMGGGDKALTALGGRPALAHLVERFRPQVATLALSANGDPARFAEFGLTVLADPPGGPEGPLGGVLAGIDWAAGIEGATHLATVPGDAPFPAEDLVRRLAEAAGAGAAAAHGPDGVEPLHALWPIAARVRIAALVAEGVQSPRRMLERLDAAGVRFSDDGGFLDLDEPADVARAESALARPQNRYPPRGPV